LHLREEQHSARLGSKYTKKHGFKKIVYYEEYDSLETARQREIQIKKWKRKKKENLINGLWGQEW
jgi:putative endonuclease